MTIFRDRDISLQVKSYLLLLLFPFVHYIQGYLNCEVLFFLLIFNIAIKGEKHCVFLMDYHSDGVLLTFTIVFTTQIQLHKAVHSF